jgi:hypothetical protein
MVYEFSLKFALADHSADPEQHLDALFEAGCDDATIGIGKRGAIALSFAREAVSAKIALSSAIKTAQKAIPGAMLIETSFKANG